MLGRIDFINNKSTFSTAKHLTTINSSVGVVTCLLKLKNKNTLLSGSRDDGIIKLWCLRKNACIDLLYGHADSVMSLIELKNGFIASGSNDAKIKIWNTLSKKCLTTLYGHTKGVKCVIEISIIY